MYNNKNNHLFDILKVKQSPLVYKQVVHFFYPTRKSKKNPPPSPISSTLHENPSIFPYQQRQNPRPIPKQ